MSAVIRKAVAHMQRWLYCSHSIFAVIKVELISPSRESAVHPQEKQCGVRWEIKCALPEILVTGQEKK